ncbi:MAG: hypothetical protein Kilf2KO_03560 [Rhodospirillales bacterium]
MTAEPCKFMLRPIAPEDSRAIAEMAAALSAHEGMPPPLVVPQDLAEELARPDCLLLGYVALAGSDYLGYALHTMTFDTEAGRRGAFLCDLYVSASARRQGIAQALIAAVVQDTNRRGGTWLSWGALANNTVGRAFYATVGEVEAGVELWSLRHDLFKRFAGTA